MAASILDTLSSDMTLGSEAIPHGYATGWGLKPRVNVGNNPSWYGFSRALAWGVVYEASTGNAATNTRVEVKDMELWILSKSTGKWSLIQESDKVLGGLYLETWANNSALPVASRQESDGGTSATPGNGRDWHFWSDITGSKLASMNIDASDVAGVITSYQARLVVDDPTKADDRSSARYVAASGADYWNSTMTSNADAGIGRFKVVTNDYQTFSMTTLTAAQLAANPPTAYMQEFADSSATTTSAVLAAASTVTTTAAASTTASSTLASTSATTSTTTKAATAAATSAPVAYDVSRFYDTVTGDHFYTSSTTEKAQILANTPSMTYEGAAFATPTKADNTQDVFRFYDASTGTHFLTASTAERDSILASLPNYTYEGVVFEAYKDASAPGAVTLERFYNTATNLHHYALPDEADGIRAGSMGANWVDEGAGFIVHAATGKTM